MHEDVPLKSSVGVVGAGIQGVCISLCLIKKGFKVILIDRDDPAEHSDDVQLTGEKKISNNHHATFYSICP